MGWVGGTLPICLHFTKHFIGLLVLAGGGVNGSVLSVGWVSHGACRVKVESPGSQRSRGCPGNTLMSTGGLELPLLWS